jgi:large repetitive protein
MNLPENLHGRENRGINYDGGGGSMKRAFTILAALFCSFAQVQAAPVSYSLTTTASGTLGGTSFTNAQVTVTLTGDTANVQPVPAPYADALENSGNATVNVAGFPTATFTDPIVIISTLNDTASPFGGPAVLILDNTTGTGILFQTGSIFSTYDLRSSLGPLSGTGGVASGSHMTPIFPTTAGNFTWAIGQPSGTSTFTAVATQTALPLQIPGGGGAAMVTLTSGMVSTPYSQTLPAMNGIPPYTWSVLGGALPQSLSLTSSGTLSGTPTQAGTFEFTGEVTDSSGASASSMFRLVIAPQALTITTPFQLPNGIVGSDYSPQLISVTGGNPPYTLQIAGALPGGLTFSGGEISGIPTAAATGSFAVNATDSSSPPLATGATFQLTVGAATTDLILSQGSLAFSLATGASGLPPGSNVSVRSSVAAQSLNYSVTVTPAAAWLDVTGTGTGDPTTPGIIGINLDPSALSLGAGVSNTSVVITCVAPSPCAGSSHTISVSLTVAAASPQLFVTTSLLAFTAQASNPQPVSLTMGLRNIGGGTITVNSVTAADSYVTIAGPPTTLAAGPSFPFMVTVNPANLTAGFYHTTILVNTSAGTVNVPVTVLVAQNPTMTLNPAGVLFPQEAGSSPGNPNGSFLVTVSGNSTVYWTATLLPLPGPNWVTLNTSSGSSTAANPGAISFSINPAVAATLMARSYWAAIQVASSSVEDSPQTFIVVLDAAPATSPSVPVPTPAGLLFLSNGTTTPPAQTVHVYASSQTPLTYQASSDSPWLLVTSPSGSASGATSTASPGSTSVSVNPSGLVSGVYRGNVSYALSSAAVRTINVTLVVEPGAGAADRHSKAVTCTPTQLVPTQTGLVNNFSQPTGFPTPLSVQLVDNCGNPIANGAIDATFSNGDPPLALVATDTTTGIYSGTWTPRTTSAQITVNARATAAGFAAVSVQILGQVTPNPAPLLTPNGTLDAFAIAAEPGAPIAPGTIVQIYGSNLAAQTTSASTIPLPTSLNQTSVIIGGLMAPLYFVSAGQINAQVPFELTAGNPYQVIVDANGALSTPNPIQLTNDAPGIAQFAAGQIIAQHLSNNDLVTETAPAAPGETIVFYVAGMGLTNPAVASGTASPSSNLPVLLDTPTLTLNGAPVPAANIIFAGLTPTLVGLYQVDFTVPSSAPNGDLPLVLTQTSGLSNSTILPVHN